MLLQNAQQTSQSGNSCKEFFKKLKPCIATGLLFIMNLIFFLDHSNSPKS